MKFFTSVFSKKAYSDNSAKKLIVKHEDKLLPKYEVKFTKFISAAAVGLIALVSLIDVKVKHDDNVLQVQSISIGSAAHASFDSDVPNGSLIRLASQGDNYINLTGNGNGGLVNSYRAVKDKDSLFRVISLGGNRVVLIKNGTNIALSVKGSIPGSTLETWNYVPGAWQQIFTLVPGEIPGQYYIENRGLRVNIPYGRHNVAMTLMRNAGRDPEQMFGVEIVSKGGDPTPPTKINDVKLEACTSASHSCTRPGYNGIDNWGFHNSSSIRGGFKHNCTAYAAWQASQLGASHPGVNLGNANTWAARASSVGIPVTTNPVVGSVAVREVGYYGHVAVVEAIDGDSIWISEDNYDANNGGWTSVRKVHKSTFQKYILFGRLGR
jgi:surface antigen